MKGENSSVMLVIAIVAVVVSVGALLASMGNQVLLQPTPSDQGDVSLNITAESSINFTVDSIKFGSGAIPPGSPNENLTTEDLLPLGASANDGVSVPGGYWNRSKTSSGGDGKGFGGFVIENNGNTPIMLSLKTNINTATFIGGTNPRFEGWMSSGAGTLAPSSNLARACPTGSRPLIPGQTPAGDYAAIYSNMDAFVAAPVPVCNYFNHTAPDDKLDLGFRISIPQSAFPGSKSVTVTATASPVLP